MTARTPNDHCTPAAVLEVVQAFAPIVLDPCANPWSLVPAESWCSSHDGGDGLALPWEPFQGLVFVNPPYGRGQILPWVRKAALEADIGAEVVMLVPCSPETAWSRLARVTCDAYVTWDARIAFEGAGGQGMKGPSRLYYWGPRAYLFAHVLHDRAAEVYVSTRPRIAFPRRAAA